MMHLFNISVFIVNNRYLKYLRSQRCFQSLVYAVRSMLSLSFTNVWQFQVLYHDPPIWLYRIFECYQNLSKIFLNLQYWWTSYQHFKVPVFWEILPLSEQNRMIKTPSPNTKFEWIYLGLSIFKQSSNQNHTL
jgi:hypothetical protein